MHLLSLVDAYCRRSALIVLRLLARPFSGLSVKGSSPLITFSRLLVWLDYSHLVFLYKLHSPTPWLLSFDGFTAISD